MPTTLTNGIQLPDKGSVDWYSSMQSNYNLIDTHLGDTDVHVTAEDKANWNSKQGSLSQAQLDAIAQVATNTSDIATLQTGKANASHTHSSSDITDIGDYATKTYVDNSISGLVDNAPDALNTLNELSAALNDDANFASTVTTALAAKADSSDLATVATSGSYDDLSNKPSIPTNTSDLNNDSGFITLNDFDIPSKTSDLTNDSGFITSSDVPTSTSDLINDSNFVDTSNSAVASGITSAKVTDYDSHIADTDIHVTTADKNKWNNGVTQSYVFRYSGTAVVPNSTIAYSTIDNTDNIKSGDKILDVDGKLFEITAVDTTNQTVTVGSALIDLALDANVVHTSEINSSGIGIIEAVKEVGGVDFNTLTTQGLYGTNAGGSTNNPENSPCVVQVIRRLKSVIQIASVSSSAYKSRYIRYCADITAQPPVWQSWIKFATDDNVMHLSGNETVRGIKTFSDSPIFTTFDGIRFRCTHNPNAYITFRNANQANPGSIIFSANDGNVGTSLHLVNKTLIPYTNGDIDLGTSLRKWKSFNGINPGALSLPDLSNGIDISSYITDLTGASNINKYTPVVNGWISVGLSNAEFIELYIPSALMGGTFTKSSTSNYAQAFMPVIANKEVRISLKGASIGWAKFYPCLGNV